MMRVSGLPVFILLFVMLASSSAKAQCIAGYSQAQLNWDNLDYHYNSGGSNPYGVYVTNAIEQAQSFAIGTNWLRVVTSSTALVTTSENGTHTGELSGYTGDDVQFNPDANGQTITITFNSEVRNVNFTLYDIDLSARIDFSARNAANVAQNIGLTVLASTILTRNNNNTTTAYFTSSATGLANNSNQGSGTVSVAGPVKTITITVTTIGTDAVFWLSDIIACVTGSFPTDYHQSFDTQPFLAPVGLTENQPDYFLVTPDNNSGYMIDPATGNARWLFTDASKTYMNSFGYDIQNKILYYISENSSLNSSNKTLKKYDFNTETNSTVIANITTTLGIPTFNSGIESAAAAFYDGHLYIGIEGGASTSTIRESMVWRIDLATSTACQVFATPSYNGSGLLHDWADFLVKDGELINFNSAQNGDYANSCYTHLNLMTGAAVKYYNPAPASKFAGQAGMDWSGNYYTLFNTVQFYNGDGTLGSSVPITVVSGPAWVGNAGDAAENFRPKSDFGDAPATYDPDLRRPAVHERQENISIGTGWDREWIKKGVTTTEDTDDGLAYVPILGPGSGTSYIATVSVLNNSGSPATLCAWLDYNGNGVFDVSEAITPITVNTSAVSQDVVLYWPLFSCSLPVGSYTQLRIRITSASAGMTGSHPTGYFANGEVEDYRVLVDNHPLAANLLKFEARVIQNRKVILNWKASEEPDFSYYEVERSADGYAWMNIDSVHGKSNPGTFQYTIKDGSAPVGGCYYRLKLIYENGSFHYSAIRYVSIVSGSEVTVSPNPAKDIASVKVSADLNSRIIITVFDESGTKMHGNSFIMQSAQANYRLPLTSWLPGAYFVNVSINGRVVSRKLIVIR